MAPAMRHQLAGRARPLVQAIRVPSGRHSAMMYPGCIRGRRCPLVEPPRWGLVQVPEDHLADLAARSPPLAARDAVVAAFLYRCHAKLIQINLGSLMFTLSGCWAGHGTGSYPMGRASKRADLSGRSSMASSVGETGGHGGHVPAAWPGLSGRCLGPEGRRSSELVEVMSHHREVTIR